MSLVISVRIAAVALAISLPTIGQAFAGCLKVGIRDEIEFDPAALTRLETIGIGKKEVFAAILDVSIPETEGCWAASSGNFDGQLVSVGTLQWNFGQQSLQPMLKRYRSAFLRGDEFKANIDRLMPIFGNLVFSPGCLRPVVTQECKQALLAAQTAGRLNPNIKAEFDALFESREMIQIQMDRFVALLGSVSDQLQRLFPGEKPTPRQIKWAIDTKVQQGQFPGTADVKRVREKLATLSSTKKAEALLSLVAWYEGLCTSADQGGIRFDCGWNATQWRKTISAGDFDASQLDLLYLSFLRSRTAVGMSGHWQALTFQRRAKIILGVGSIGGRRYSK